MRCFSLIIPQDQYAVILTFMAISILLSGIMIFLPYIFSKRNFRDSEKTSEYECGFEPFDSATRQPFTVHFYIVGILFLIFDVEMALLFPWSVILQNGSWYSYWLMVFFLFLLAIGFLYEWKVGAINWNMQLIDNTNIKLLTVYFVLPPKYFGIKWIEEYSPLNRICDYYYDPDAIEQKWRHDGVPNWYPHRMAVCNSWEDVFWGYAFQFVVYCSVFVFSILWYRVLLHWAYKILNGANNPLWYNKEAQLDAPWLEKDLFWLVKFWRMTSTGWYPMSVYYDRSGQSENPQIDHPIKVAAFFMGIVTYMFILCPWMYVVNDYVAFPKLTIWAHFIYTHEDAIRYWLFWPWRDISTLVNFIKWFPHWIMTLYLSIWIPVNLYYFIDDID